MCSLTDNYKLYGPFFGNFGSHRVDERTNVSRFNNNVFITREKSIEYGALLLNLKGMLNSEKDPDPLEIFTVRLYRGKYFKGEI